MFSMSIEQGTISLSMLLAKTADLYKQDSQQEENGEIAFRIKNKSIFICTMLENLFLDVEDLLDQYWSS